MQTLNQDSSLGISIREWNEESVRCETMTAMMMQRMRFGAETLAGGRYMLSLTQRGVILLRLPCNNCDKILSTLDHIKPSST
jgi:hypothetical protein